jgi:wobble nucleotide-excising tRNase
VTLTQQRYPINVKKSDILKIGGPIVDASSKNCFYRLLYKKNNQIKTNSSSLKIFQNFANRASQIVSQFFRISVLKALVIKNPFLKTEYSFIAMIKNKPMAPTILERGLPICGLRPSHVCEVSR